MGSSGRHAFQKFELEYNVIHDFKEELLIFQKFYKLCILGSPVVMPLQSCKFIRVHLLQPAGPDLTLLGMWCHNRINLGMTHIHNKLYRLD